MPSGAAVRESASSPCAARAPSRAACRSTSTARSSARSASPAWPPTRMACAPRRESKRSSSFAPRPQGVLDVLRRAHAHRLQSRGARAFHVLHRVVEEEDALHGDADLARDRLEGRALGLALAEL